MAHDGLTIESYVEQAAKLARATNTTYAVLGNKREFDVMPLYEVEEFRKPKNKKNWEIERVVWPNN